MQITLAAQEELAVVQLTSPLAYFFIPPEFLSVPPFLFSIYIRCTMQCLTHPRTCTCTHTQAIYHPYCLISRLSLVLEIEPLNRDGLSCPEEGEVCPWCGARWSCSLRNGSVRLGYVKCPC